MPTNETEASKGNETNEQAGQPQPGHAEQAQPAEERSAESEEALKERIAQLEAELAEMKDKWLRALAEADNVRKRAEREIEQTRKYAIERFAHALLDVIDNLERALEAKGDPEALREGVRLTLQSWRHVMEQFEMERIDAVGKPFDPHHHEALMHLPSDEHPAGVVMAQHVPGYKIAGRLLRPAKVVVSKGPEKQPEEQKQQQEKKQESATDEDA